MSKSIRISTGDLVLDENDGVHDHDGVQDHDDVILELYRTLNTLLDLSVRLDRIETDLQHFRRDLAREQYEEYR